MTSKRRQKSEETPPVNLEGKTLDGELPVDLTGATLNRDPSQVDLTGKTMAGDSDLPPPGVDLNQATFDGPLSDEKDTSEVPVDLSAKTLDSGSDLLGVDLSARTLDGDSDHPLPDLNRATATQGEAETADIPVDLNGTTLGGEEEPDLSAATLAGPPDGAATTPAPVNLEGDTYTTLTDAVRDEWQRTITDDLTAGMTIKSEEPAAKKAEPKNDKHATHITVNIRNVIDTSTAPASPTGKRTVVMGKRGEGKADYELLDVLGEGGMGIVYQARQSAIDRSIALKMIKKEAARDKGARKKFLFEAAVTGDLDHPNIIPIHDLGDNGEGALFYAMKHIKGKPWCDVIGDKSLGENLDIFDDVCNGMQFAHDRGIIHRDLKPENIMIGGYGETLVMDWGLAAGIHSGCKAPTLSKKTPVCGTPAYMSPEMAVGDGTRIGVCSDIYLLGAILYEAVTGTAPHSGQTVLKCLENAALNVIIETDKQSELVDIARKAMATQVEDRYQTVEELKKAIKEYQAHHESISLAQRAQEALEEADEKLEYEIYGRAVFGFQEAIKTWSHNSKAGDGLSDARYRYAQCAYDKGDYDLAESQLVEMTGRFKELRNKVVHARVERDKKQRQLRLAKYAGMVAAAIFLVGISVAAYWINDEKKKATANMNLALKNAKEARLAKADADKKRIEADKARATAETRRLEAVAAKKDAETQAKIAKTQRDRAEKALKLAEQADRVRRFNEAREKKLQNTARWRKSAEEAKALQAEKAASLNLPVEQVIQFGDGILPMRFRLIPNGTFTMGSPPDEEGRRPDEALHDVVISKPFYMGVCEVNRGQWRAIAGGLPAKAADNRSITDRYPVESVSYQVIVEEFLPKLQKRALAGYIVDLPTEAEWEHACRAFSDTPWFFGSESDDFGKHEWCITNSPDQLRPTGIKNSPNPWGLHDMHGNVAEWCKDWYQRDSYLQNAVKEQKAAMVELAKIAKPTTEDFQKLVRFMTDPFVSEPAKNGAFRVVRGGHYGVYPQHARSAIRSSFDPKRYDSRIGFRLVLRKK